MMKQNHARRFGLAMVAFIMLLCVDLGILAQSGGMLGYGSKVYGSISATTALATYSFSGQEGDFVSLTADSWTGTLDVHLELVAPNGVILDHSAQITPYADPLGADLSVFLPQTGIYVLRLSGDNATVGDFLLSLLGRSAVIALPLRYGEAVDVDIPQAAPAQYFAFEAQACPTTLIISEPSEGLPYAFPFVVKLRNQRGQTVALLRGGQQLEDWVTVAANSGRYEVEVLTADPARSGSLRLLVTCSGDNPGCPPGSAAAASAVCPSCPDLEEWLDGGGCPDLGLTADQDPTAPSRVTARWNLMPGADSYAVYVIGDLVDGGEVYLTHSEWTPGDPPQFTWMLPEAGYAGYILRLQALVGGVVICTDEVAVSLPGQQVVCPDLGLAFSADDPSSGVVLLTWFGLEWVEGYQLTVYGTDASGVETELYASEVMPPGVTSMEYTLPDDYNSFRFWLRLVGAPAECSSEIGLARQQPPGGVPCAIRADHEGVAVRVGPGTARSQFAYLLPGIEYTVVGQAADATGALWWQLDKTQFAGHEGVISLWVAQADVIALGDCSQVPETEIPPVIPEPEEPPDGSWGACGSCDSCGFPAEECVTSPTGECLWDPATCRGQPPPPNGGQSCYAVSVAIDMGSCFGSGAAMIDTPPNCAGGLYTPGTTIQAHAVAVDPKCTVRSWSGCGASGSSSSVSFVPAGSCTVVAHMGY